MLRQDLQTVDRRGFCKQTAAFAGSPPGAGAARGPDPDEASICSMARACQKHARRAPPVPPGIAPRSVPGLQGSANHRLIEPLSGRELQVLLAVCEGDSNQEIAGKFDLKVTTVKYHVYHIFGKLGVRRRTQAVAVAIYLGLVRPKWFEKTLPGTMERPGARAA